MGNTPADQGIKAAKEEFKPTLELRGLKASLSLSEETLAYTARLFVNGKFFCSVSNHGTGGPEEYGIHGKELEDLQRLVSQTFPKMILKDGEKKIEYETDLDCECQKMVGEDCDRKSLKRRLKTKVIFKLGEKMMEATMRYNELVASRIMKKYPEAIILNPMEFEEAFSLYNA